MPARFTCLAALAVASLAAAAFADTVQLTNGDRLTGTITRITPDAVEITTPYAGAITLKRNAVKTMWSQEPVTIAPAEGPARTAYIAPTAEGWAEAAQAVPEPSPVAATPVAAAPVAAAPGPVVAPAPRLNLQGYYLPIGPDWTNVLTVGVLNTSGNTDSSQFTAEAVFAQKKDTHELTLKFGGAYAVTSGEQTLGLAYSDIIYRRNLPWQGGRWYAFAENDNRYDGVKGISLRSTTAGGLGYNLFAGERFDADLRAGPGFTYQRYFDGTADADAVILVGFRAAYAFSDRVQLTQDLEYSQAMFDPEHYVVTSETALNIKLAEVQRGLGIKLAFRNDYDNATQPPNSKNDTRFTAGLTLEF